MLGVESSNIKLSRDQIDALKMACDPIEPATKKELEALVRLWDSAHGYSRQSHIVASFLLGLYCGPRFKVDLTEFRALDSNMTDDCLTVLGLDVRRICSIESHLENALGRRCTEAFEKLAVH